MVHQKWVSIFFYTKIYHVIVFISLHLICAIIIYKQSLNLSITNVTQTDSVTFIKIAPSLEALRGNHFSFRAFFL